MSLELFLQTEPKILINTHSYIRLKDIASIYCIDDVFVEEIKDLIIDETKTYNNQVISIIKVIKKIKEVDKDVNIIIHGPPEILVSIENENVESSIFKFLKVTIVSLLLFFGASIAIINFHDDVSMQEGLSTINYIVTGTKDENPLLLTIPYSLGLGIGMVAFFQRALKKKQKKKNEPSPLQLEMYSYKKNIDDYILDETKHN